jgi:adenine deaminase
MLEATAVSLHAAHEAGVRFAMGTDTGFAMTPYGEWHARELELLVTYAGLTPLEAITAGTANGARMLGLDDEVGQIRAGMLADVLVVDGDPLRDLRVLLDPHRMVVLKGGVVQGFPEGIDTSHYRHDPLPHFYAAQLLTKEAVFEDGPTGPYAQLPWCREEAADLLADLRHATVEGVAAGMEAP